VCSAGTCVVSCGAGLSNCGGVCRDLSNDLANCGACGRACTAGQVCSAGTCVVSCGAGLSNCGGVCRDLDVDNRNCGMCGRACAAGTACANGVCEVSCGAGLSNCAGVCRDTQSDPAHCGMCGRACATGQVCARGVCALLCGTGQTACGGACVDLQTDASNCGVCGTRCPVPTGGGAVCARGVCGVTCTPPLVPAGALCVQSEYGNGADGDGVVSGTRDLSRESIAGRPTPDAPWFTVTALGISSATLSLAPAGLAAGDEVLLINLQGAPAAVARVGTYEFLKVQSVVGSSVVFTAAVANTYGASSNASLAGQVVAMVRVPAYASVTVRAASVLTTQAFNGATGGVLAFRVAGDLNVAATGRVDMAARGYRGGAPGAVSDQDSYQGESRTGAGCGGQVGNCAAGYLNSPCNACWQANDGGGGASVTGGGGNHGGGATPGVSWNGGGSNPPSAGGTYGAANLSLLTLGSGGGGTWRGGDVMSLMPGPGGNGGGAIFFTALRANLGAGAVTVGGETCTSASAGSFDYGCGGGAGGALYVRIQSLVATGVVGVAGGGAGVVPPSPSGRIPRPGGNGGVGRVRVDVRTINSLMGGTADGNTAVNAAFEPDPGFIAVPP
jgi:hypothetical protein